LTQPYKIWTTSERTRITELRKQGMTIKEIADVLGRTTASIQSAIRYVSPPPRARRPIMEVTPSDELRDATLTALLRWADSNGTTIDEAAGFLLSGKPLDIAA
jgi:transcriptional regulator